MTPNRKPGCAANQTVRFFRGGRVVRLRTGDSMISSQANYISRRRREHWSEPFAHPSRPKPAPRAVDHEIYDRRSGDFDQLK
jgi:hypothetical protein